MESHALWYLAGMRKSSFFYEFYSSIGLLCLLALAGTSIIAQDAASTLPTDPKALMLLAAKTNGITGDGLKPWHLKTSYTQFDGEGNVKSEGTIEEFWVAPTKFKLTYASGDLSMTEYGSGKGQCTVGGSGMDLLPLYKAFRELIHPLPPAQDIQENNFVFQQRDAGGIQATCVQRQSPDGALAGLTWCFDPRKPALRISVDGYGPDALHSNPVLFQGRYIAGEIKYSDGDLRYIEGDKGILVLHLDTIEPLSSLDDEFFTPPSNARCPQPINIAEIQSEISCMAEAPLKIPNTLPSEGGATLSAAIAGGNLCAKVAPLYPPEAKAAHVQGTVVLKGVVDKQGHMKNIEAVSGAEMLQQSAIDAVKQWRYRPYLLNGNPVEVQTTVNVIFTLDNSPPAPPRDEGAPPSPAVTPRPEIVNISGGVAMGMLAQKVPPHYPVEAKEARVSGTVVLQATIGLDGHVEDLSVISGPDLLQQVALDAVKQWVYRPYLLNGEPVKVQTTINVIFTLGR